MTLPQHLVESLATTIVGDSVTVEGDEAHHAVVVRRLRVGEALQLSDGAGRVATAEVVDLAEPQPRITVVQALPKGDRGELAVEVLTEIGVSRIVPWAASRSVAVWKGERAAKSHAKWQATAREAAKQSRRAWHPVVEPLASTDEVAGLVSTVDVAVVLHEDATEPLSALALPPDGDLLVVVGPEGGLTGDEVTLFVRSGAVAVRLGAEVLRTSTAGVAATSALLSRTARWGGSARPPQRASNASTRATSSSS